MCEKLNYCIKGYISATFERCLEIGLGGWTTGKLNRALSEMMKDIEDFFYFFLR